MNREKRYYIRWKTHCIFMPTKRTPETYTYPEVKRMIDEIRETYFHPENIWIEDEAGERVTE